MKRRTAIIALLAFAGVCAVLLGLILYWWNRPPQLPVALIPVDAGLAEANAGPERDPWLREEPNFDWTQWSERPQELTVPVPEASQEEVVKLLEEAPLEALTDADLKTFVPTPPSVPPDYKPYLLRCVFIKAPDGRPMRTGHFYTYRRGQDVLVFFGCLGQRNWGTARGALVVWLPFKPKNVFVLCQMAE